MSRDNANFPRRRAFFREAAARLVTPLADYLEARGVGPAVRTRLRPPGAIDEQRFLETCHRCGACVDSCPADAIFPLDETKGEAVGTPSIDPDRAACVVCDGLNCTTSCPSGALLPLLSARDVRMGVAMVYAPLCVRSRGESCTLCVDRCPMGDAAIRIGDDDLPEVRTPGCVGCGVCQLSCPTDP